MRINFFISSRRSNCDIIFSDEISQGRTLCNSDIFLVALLVFSLEINNRSTYVFYDVPEL